MPPLSVRQLCSYSYSVKFVAQWTKTVCPRAHWMLSKQNSYNMWLASEMSSRAHILNVRAPAVALFWVVVERFRSRAQLEEGGHGWRTIPGPFPLWPLLPDQSWSEELSTICTSNHDVLSKHMGPSDDGLNLLKLWKGSKKKILPLMYFGHIFCYSNAKVTNVTIQWSIIVPLKGTASDMIHTMDDES